MSPPPSPPANPVPVPANTFTADYPSLFGDHGLDRCPDEALESSFGPFAYAESLIPIVRRLESKVGDPPVSPLASRRPDMARLLLDEPTLNRQVPRLTLAIECLEAMVESTHGDGQKAAAILAASMSPANLPFDHAWGLVVEVLRNKRQHPWQLLRQTDEDYPNFSHRAIVNTSMRSALTLCTGMAPAQLRALENTPEATDSALWSSLGLPTGSLIDGLADSATFSKATSLSRKHLRQLLAVNGVAKDGDTGTYTSVTVSKAGKPDGQPDSSAFGARFVNDGQSPALRLVAGGAKNKITRIENLGAGHLQRIDSMLRLHAGTGLPFADLDRLLQAIFGAQGRNVDFKIDVHALRALGLYCHLRDSRRVDLGAYAAVLHEISPYATGRDTPYYDKLFRPGSSLTMDNEVFVSAGNDPTTQRLCAGLGVGPGTLSVLLEWATKAQGLAVPTRNLPFVSACHRLAVLPRWLGHDEKEGLALLRLFEQTQPGLFSQLAGAPILSKAQAAPSPDSDTGDEPDIVDAIVTLMNFSEWLRRHRLDAMSLRTALSTGSHPEDDLVRLIPDTSAQRDLQTVTDNRLRDAFLDMPFAKDAKRAPTELLSSLIEGTGLFKDAVFAMDEAALDATIGSALDAASDRTAGNLPANAPRLDRTKKHIGQSVRGLLEGQRTLVEQTLAALLPGIADPVMRTTLAEWAGASPTSILGLLDADGSRIEKVVPWLDVLRQRSQMVSQLAIDAPSLTAMRAHREWFDLDKADIENAGLIVVHRLSEWNKTVRDVAARSGIEAGKTSEDLLGYLGTASDTKQGDPVTRLANLLRVDEAVVTCVAACVTSATPDASLTTASHIAWLLRLQSIADRTTISVEALLALANLSPQSGVADMEAAGQLLLATCQSSERDLIVGTHNAAWRDAMVAWLLSRATDTDGRKFANRDELSAWLLTDLDVGPEPETTRLAAALDSLQLYIHRLLSGLEKHLSQGANIKEERRQWSAYRSRYVDWRQYRERREYPENHIHPARRQHKTNAFLDLESQLAQGQARPTDIDTTLLAYLAGFEQTSNIQVISAYHDGIDPTRDLLHLVGRSNIEPYEYFWQSARMDVKAADGHTGMLAWSGWKKIDLPINGELTRTRIPRPLRSAEDLAKALQEDLDAAGNGDGSDATAASKARDTEIALSVARNDEDDSRDGIETIRPLTIDGRQYVVWVERDTSAIVFDTETAASEYYALRVCYSFLDTNDNWSASNTLLSLDGYRADGTRPKPGTDAERQQLFKRSHMPGLIVMENRKGQRESEPYLVAMLFDSKQALPTKPDDKIKWVTGQNYFLAVRDLLLIDEKRLDGTSSGDTLEQALVGNWFDLYRDPRVVQHPYIGAKYGLKPSEEGQVIKVADGKPAALQEKLFMDGPDSVGLTVELTSSGSEIEVTGSLNDEWSSRKTLQKEIKSIEDIDRVHIDHTIRVSGKITNLFGKSTSFDNIVECRLSTSIDANSWNADRIVFKRISIRGDSILKVYTGRDLEIAEGTVSSRLTDENAATTLLESIIPEIAFQTRSLAPSKELSSLLTNPNLLSGVRARTVNLKLTSRGTLLGKLTLTCEDVRIPCVLESALPTSDQQACSIPIKAELVRVGKTQAAGSVATDATLLADLKSKDRERRQDLETQGNLETLHALAISKSDRAALVTWLPALTDIWRIPARDYYEALRNEGLEYGTSDESALSGSLPFLQAMHATNREPLRDAFVRLVANTLGATLPDKTRDKLPLDLRMTLVRFAAREHASYRELLERLAKLVAGNSAEVVIKTEVMDAHARGTKRIVARIPVDADETDYTFRLILSATDDPADHADGEYHEWIRLTTPYTLTNLTETSTQLPDDRVPTARIRRNRAQAQYLDLDESGMPPIRLNTLFGKQLVARATRSVDAALSIEAQTLPEPALLLGGSGGFVDFRGANGLYFWELFFHVPWLVAWSLREKGQYAEAWQWCSRYLFDPYRGCTTETTAPIPFWNCLPLVYPLDGARNTGEAVELAGYENSIHFRKAIHAFLVDLWRMQGDEQFRQVNPDSMREANLCYHKALQLIGTLQEPAEARPWTPSTLGSRKASFVQPVNRALRDRRALLLARLDNLRHGRTIDGVLIPYLGYGDEDAESGWSGGRRGSTAGLRALSLNTMPAYRFREVMTSALGAVARLTELGRYLFRIYEHEADNALEVERQKNLVALADFDISLKRKAVETARRERNTLQLSQQAIQERIQYFAGQLASPRSGLEIAGSTLAAAGVAMQYARLVPISVGAGLKVLPSIYGMAVGGHRAWGPSEGIDMALEVTAEGTRLLAEDLRTEASYERRNEEWAHDKAQAEHDLRILTSQLDEQISRAASAAIELSEATKRRECLRNEFEVQTTGFAIASTYTWMLGRLGELFASAYQSVFTLCLDAEASYRYETGDFDSRHVRLDAWDGSRRGMFAGEALQNDLHALQSAYLRRHVRRLGIHRTISLRALLGDELVKQLNTGTLRFSLDTKLFDADFPGHYLRQIRHLAVALVPKTGASALRSDTEIRAVLTQSSNTLLYRPDPDGVEWLYDPDKGSAEAILRDLRGDQQAVLSHASPRPSADPMESIVLHNEYADGRYGTFEGTGAISSWTLTFPGDKNDSRVYRDEIEDIQIRLDYAAAWGGEEFSEKVDSLLAASPTTNAGRVAPISKPVTTPDNAGGTNPSADVPSDASTYPTPTVREVRANNAIDRRDIPKGATVAVAPWPSIRKGQQLWLQCLGTTADGASLNRELRAPPMAVTENEVMRGIEATIPLAYLNELGDYARVKVVLKVSLDGTGEADTATAFPELQLDLPACVALQITSDNHVNVTHYSKVAPSPASEFGFVAVHSDQGPTELSVRGTQASLRIPVVGSPGNTGVVILTANRVVDRFPRNLDSTSRSVDRSPTPTGLLLHLYDSENVDLAPDKYTGSVVIQMMESTTNVVRESIVIDLDVTHPLSGSVPQPPGMALPAGPIYPAPVVPEVRARNALDRRDIPSGTTITVAPWPWITAGHRIWLRCEGTKADGSASNLDLFPKPRLVTAGEVATGISVRLPFDYVDGLGDYGQLRIVFKVALDGSTDEARSNRFPELVIDIPKCVALSVTTAATDKDWVPHTSPPTPWIPTHAGYLALTAGEGPTTLAWCPPSPTSLKATVVSDDGGTEYPVYLRARRMWEGGSSFAMNDWSNTAGTARYCGGTYFRIQCLASDNPDLPAGKYTGRLILQLTGKHGPVVIESLFIDINLTRTSTTAA